MQLFKNYLLNPTGHYQLKEPLISYQIIQLESAEDTRLYHSRINLYQTQVQKQQVDMPIKGNGKKSIRVT